MGWGGGGAGGGADVQPLPCPLASSGLKAGDREMFYLPICLTSDLLSDFSVMFELFPAFS